jgi:hypothetical protein
MTSSYRGVFNSVNTDTITESATSGITALSDLHVTAGKQLFVNQIVSQSYSGADFVQFPTGILVDKPAGMYVSDIYERTLGDTIILHNEVDALDDVTVGGALFADDIRGASGINLNPMAGEVVVTAGERMLVDRIGANGAQTTFESDVVMQSGDTLRADDLYTLNLNASTGSIITAYAGLTIDGSRALSVYQAEADILTARSPGTSIDVQSDLVVDDARKVVTELAQIDSIEEKNSGQGVSITDKLLLTSTATSTSSSDEALYVDTSSGEVKKKTVQRLAVASFIDDFSLVALGLTPPAAGTLYIICDKPWLMYCNYITEIEALSDFGGSVSPIANPYNDMNGCAFFKWSTPSNLSRRYMCLNNGFACAPANGTIEAVFRLRIPDITSASFVEEDVFFGLGREALNSGTDFDLNGVVGFVYKKSVSAYMAVIYGGVGAPATSTVDTAIVQLEDTTLTYRIVLDSSFNCTWYIGGTQVYTANVGSMSRLGPRICHSYIKNGGALPTCGIVIDTVSITQNYNRN